jgi:hypothetical protein
MAFIRRFIYDLPILIDNNAIQAYGTSVDADVVLPGIIFVR